MGGKYSEVHVIIVLSYILDVGILAIKVDPVSGERKNKAISCCIACVSKGRRVEEVGVLSVR